MSRPGPVTIIKADGTQHTTSARDFQRGKIETQPSPDEDLSEVSRDELEAQLVKTLLQGMKHGDTVALRTSAATAAVKYLAIKYRMGPEMGADLDEE